MKSKRIFFPTIVAFLALSFTSSTTIGQPDSCKALHDVADKMSKTMAAEATIIAKRTFKATDEKDLRGLFNQVWEDWGREKKWVALQLAYGIAYHLRQREINVVWRKCREFYGLAEATDAETYFYLRAIWDSGAERPSHAANRPRYRRENGYTSDCQSSASG